MSDSLDIPGLLPLTPEQQGCFKAYLLEMEHVTKPEIVECVWERQKAAAIARNWFVN